MTPQSLRLLHPEPLAQPSWSALPSAQDAEKLIQGHYAPNINHIHHSQNSYFTASSHPEIVQRYIALYAGLCCDVWAFVFSPKTSGNISLIDDDAEETYSLCSPSRTQWQNRLIRFFQGMKNFVLKNEERIKVFCNSNRLLSHYGHQGDQNN